jgi:hypothetical protein
MITEAEKLEVIEQEIERLRGEHVMPRDHPTFVTLKAIAEDIRGRQRHKISQAFALLERAIIHAKDRRLTNGAYRPGNLREIAELTIGMWPTLRQALERFNEEERI